MSLEKLLRRGHTHRSGSRANMVDLVVLGSTGLPFVNRWNGSSWSGYINLGGYLDAPPAVLENLFAHGESRDTPTRTY